VTRSHMPFGHCVPKGLCQLPAVPAPYNTVTSRSLLWICNILWCSNGRRLAAVRAHHGLQVRTSPDFTDSKLLGQVPGSGVGSLLSAAWRTKPMRAPGLA